MKRIDHNVSESSSGEKLLKHSNIHMLTCIHVHNAMHTKKPLKHTNNLFTIENKFFITVYHCLHLHASRLKFISMFETCPPRERKESNFRFQNVVTDF